MHWYLLNCILNFLHKFTGNKEKSVLIHAVIATLFAIVL